MELQDTIKIKINKEDYTKEQGYMNVYNCLLATAIKRQLNIKEGLVTVGNTVNILDDNLNKIAIYSFNRQEYNMTHYNNMKEYKNEFHVTLTKIT